MNFKLLIVIILSFNPLVFSMTRQQLKSFGKLLETTCRLQNDVTKEQVGDIDKGKFIEHRNVMCYIACIYRMSKLIKNDKIDHRAMKKQVDMIFPDEMKDPVKASIQNCRGVAKKYTDICEASFWTSKCMYDYDPENFLFV